MNDPNDINRSELVVTDEEKPSVPNDESGRGPGEMGVLLSVSDDKMFVRLDCPAPGENLEGLLESIENQMNELSISAPPERSFMEQIIREAPTDEDGIAGLVLLEGTLPVPPEDGRMEWVDAFFTDGFSVDGANQKIDYWERLEKLSVVKDQLLARVFPPTPGVPGKDVFGEELRTENPYEVKIESGPNVETGEEAGCTIYFASGNGRLRWASGVIAVDEIYTIDGDVGLETGNVSHPGAVVVKGNVKIGASIKAEGDIVVHGHVEPSNIESKGSLTAEGGLVGREDYKIELGGGVQAKYILDANINAGEDVVITNEIAHSQLKTRGQVLVPRGRIVGGEVVANRGIVVAQAGAGSGTCTKLEPGTDYVLTEETKVPQANIARIENKIETVKKQARRGAKQGAQTDDSVQELDSLGKKLAAARTELKNIVACSKKQRVREIRVFKRTFAETVIKIGSIVVNVEETIDGPRKFTLCERQITAGPLTD